MSLFSFQFGHNISVIISNAKVYIFAGGNKGYAIGDYYCNSSTGQAWIVKAADLAAAKNKGITPIAVIFSTTTSATDKGHGWKLGYALSLTEAENEDSVIRCTWGPMILETGITQETRYIYKWMTNYDGYTETYQLITRSVMPFNETNYPAFYYLKSMFIDRQEYPSTSSGWYMPSCGQWYLICSNLGGLNKDNASLIADQSNGTSTFRWNVKANDPKSIKGYEVFTTNINPYIIACSTFTNVNLIPTDIENWRMDGYWASSSFNESVVYTMIFSKTNAELYRGQDITKDETRRIRPVIAF